MNYLFTSKAIMQIGTFTLGKSVFIQASFELHHSAEILCDFLITKWVVFH